MVHAERELLARLHILHAVPPIYLLVQVSYQGTLVDRLTALLGSILVGVLRLFLDVGQERLEQLKVYQFIPLF